MRNLICSPNKSQIRIFKIHPNWSFGDEGVGYWFGVFFFPESLRFQRKEQLFPAEVPTNHPDKIVILCHFRNPPQVSNYSRQYPIIAITIAIKIPTTTFIYNHDHMKPEHSQWCRWPPPLWLPSRFSGSAHVANSCCRIGSGRALGSLQISAWSKRMGSPRKLMVKWCSMGTNHS